MPTADRIDALLPQTQCTRCGYPACCDYAEAIASGEADIDRCPPGGAEGVAALAALLDRDAIPLDPDYGFEQPPLVALIDEAICIGCTKCIRACPVDAIVGAAKRMHTIIAAECTGCELCLPPCPVDCIRLVPIAERPLARDGVLERAMRARRRYQTRKERLECLKAHPAKPSFAEIELEPSSSAGLGGDGADEKLSTPHRHLNSSHEGEDFETAAPAAPISRSAVLEAIARGRARKLTP